MGPKKQLSGAQGREAWQVCNFEELHCTFFSWIPSVGHELLQVRMRCLQPKISQYIKHNTTQHNTTQHNTTQHNTTQHNTTQHNTTQHNTTQHNTTQHNTTQINTTQHNTTQHNTTQHNTTQHNTTQHNTTQHNTTQHTEYSPALLTGRVPGAKPPTTGPGHCQ